MNFFKKLLIALICPIWFLLQHDSSSSIKGKKAAILKYMFALAITAVVIVFVYYLNKEIL